MKMVQLMRNINIIYLLSSLSKDSKVIIQRQTKQKKSIGLSGIIHICLTRIREIKKDQFRFSKMQKLERIKLNLSHGQEISHQRPHFTFKIHCGEIVIMLCHQRMLKDIGIVTEDGVGVMESTWMAL